MVQVRFEYRIQRQQHVQEKNKWSVQDVFTLSNLIENRIRGATIIQTPLPKN